MIKSLHYTVLITAVVLLTGSVDVSAQLSAYHSIIHPYDGSSRLPKTIGGITAAIPDYFSDAQLNPAGLVSYNSALFSVNTGFNSTRYKMDPEPGNKSASYSNINFYNGNFTAIFPADIFIEKTVLGISISQINTPEIEIWEGMNDGYVQLSSHSRNGNVFNGTFSIGNRLTDNLSLGLGVTNWFGRWSWYDKAELDVIKGRGKFNYNGTSYTLGLMYQHKKYSAGVSMYSPFTLMKSNQIQILAWHGKSIHHLKQRFNGAARAGIGYYLNPKITLAAGWLYQGSIIMENQIEPEFGSPASVDDKYGSSHQISLGGEYSFAFKELQLPVFLAYQISWRNKTRINYTPAYQSLWESESKKFSHSIMAGTNLQYKSYGLNLSAHWNYREINSLDSISPLLSAS